MFLLSSCSVMKQHSLSSEKLSCDIPEIDCYRFNYSSLTNFKKSYILFFSKWDKKVPKNVLSNVVEYKDISINSADEAERHILNDPHEIFVLGKFIEKKQKPREWLFIAEQAFLRSWTSMER